MHSLQSVPASTEADRRRSRKDSLDQDSFSLTVTASFPTRHQHPPEPVMDTRLLTLPCTSREFIPSDCDQLTKDTFIITPGMSLKSVHGDSLHHISSQSIPPTLTDSRQLQHLTWSPPLHQQSLSSEIFKRSQQASTPSSTPMLSTKRLSLSEAASSIAYDQTRQRQTSTTSSEKTSRRSTLPSLHVSHLPPTVSLRHDAYSHTPQVQHPTIQQHPVLTATESQLSAIQHHPVLTAIELPAVPGPLPVEQPTIWVFGYGSLLWKPDFAYRSRQVGHIKGYVRRFHQGNVTFRGRPGQPGRVANLMEEKNGQTWGVAFEIHGREEVTKVLKALYAREAVSGGYVTMTTTFYPRESQLKKNAASSTDSLSSLSEDDEEMTSDQQQQKADDISTSRSDQECYTGARREPTAVDRREPVKVLLFTVTPDSDLYLGPDTIDNMARQIVCAKGSAGSNVEYVTRTADYVRMYIPEDEDRHLFQLDAKVRELVYRAHAQDAERVRLGLADIAHDLHETDCDLQATVTAVKAS